MVMSSITYSDLFGGGKTWSSADWTDSDDRVRGGMSQSYLDTGKTSARFHGNLDIKTLGGAGFASQRTTDQEWDLSKYDGIAFRTSGGDDKKYTIIVKDTLLPKNPENGREQSTVSYEYDFSASKPAQPATVNIIWSEFKASFRGRPQEDAKPIDTSSIKQISIMIRSFFGVQEGPFTITFHSISAFRKGDDESCSTSTRSMSLKDNIGPIISPENGNEVRRCCDVM